MTYRLKSLSTKILHEIDQADKEMVALNPPAFILSEGHRFVALLATVTLASEDDSLKRRRDAYEAADAYEAVDAYEAADAYESTDATHTIGLARLDAIDYGDEIGKGVWVSFFHMGPPSHTMAIVERDTKEKSLFPDQILWSSLMAVLPEFEEPYRRLGVLVPFSNSGAVESFQERGMEAERDPHRPDEPLLLHGSAVSPEPLLVMRTHSSIPSL